MLWYAFTGALPEGPDASQIPDMAIPNGIVPDSLVRP
jgi:hypothetical protein